MQKYIEKLKTLPDDVKKVFAVGVSLFLTVVIVGVSLWISNPLSKKKDALVVASAPKEVLPSPFASLSKGMSDTFSNFKKEVSSIPFKQFIGEMAKKDAPALALIATSTTTMPTRATSTVTQMNSRIATTTPKIKPKKVNTASSTPKVIKEKISIASTTTDIATTSSSY